MATFFETIHEKYVSDHNTSVDYNKEAKGKGDYLSGKAQAYADVLDMLNSDFKVIKNTIPNKQSDVIPLWRVRDVLQGHFDYKTVNSVMDDME